ncbi:M1 family metallopeptidase [Microvirga sp. SRT01]|uniref:Aminopeptidase n=1 Tax=Sphingomonas longa TaxID=2778730 RepID=A0ABS2DBS8_9SPHN|nr:MULTISPECIES: M1 family metallopeptidase [Alphaproteobacteria]MBM6578390.1 M1 family metallopeptidase [Sphingomonas sp. BT552]MBR7711430.1 M1 family metallopeptidase [Microvirga sp. SRT01]
MRSGVITGGVLVSGLALVAAMPAVAAERQVLPADVVPLHYDVAIMPDAAALSFSGEVGTDVQVATTTGRIVVNAADLVLDSATLDGKTPLTIAIDKAAETATLTAPGMIAPGRHRVTIRWHGAISKFTSGFFALDYDDAAGTKKRMIATKFEPAAARRFMPLWDEPARKASYTLTADVPATDLALSNTPVAKEVTLPGGRKRVTFAKTPKMSSYLLFFASGDLERLSRKDGKVEVGIVTRRGVASRGQEALDTAVQLLPYYNSYFGAEYPIAKLDLIAGPGSGSFSAMENWGAIFFFENALLLDPASITESARQQIYSVVAHEMAHQWFGNLVTMDWWNDLWLNEGFASWMATTATSRFHPEWKPWLGSQIDRAGAMRLDALPGTHPVIQDVASGPAANQAFDGITYGKGEAVIRMLEAYVGAMPFQRGVQAYMAAHAYGNTVNDDLWTSIEAASGQPVAAIAADFLGQAGVPLVNVAGGGPVSQGRFSFDPAATAGRWTLPLTIRPLAGGSGQPWLMTAATTRLPTAAPTLVNAGQAAYARVSYAAPAYAPVLAAFPSLPAADQIGLLSDAWALGQAGKGPAARALELARALPADADPLAWTQALSAIGETTGLEAGTPGDAAWQGWVRATVAAPFARLGWTAKPGESANDAILREALIYTLGRADEPTVLVEAKRRFAGWQRDRASLPAALVDPVLILAGRNADAATFAMFRSAAKAEADPERKAALYAYMAGVRDPALAAEMLTIATGGEAPPARAARLVAQVARVHPDLAWTHALATLPAVAPNLDLRQRFQYLPSVASGSASAARADELHAIAARDFPEGSRRFADQAEAGIRQRARLKQTMLPKVDRWIASSGR